MKKIVLLSFVLAFIAFAGLAQKKSSARAKATVSYDENLVLVRPLADARGSVSAYIRNETRL